MQQIAAQKSDLAALSVSADRDGIDTKMYVDSSQRRDDFRTFYDEAQLHPDNKTTNAYYDKVENPKAQDVLTGEDVVRQTSREKERLGNDNETIGLPPVKPDSTDVSRSQDDDVSVKDASVDPETGHIDLPPTETDTASSSTNWLEYVESLIGHLEKPNSADSDLAALTEPLSEGMDSDALTALKALTNMLSSSPSLENAINVDGSMGVDVDDSLMAVLAQFLHHFESESNQVGFENDSQELGGITDELSADEALILSLIQDQLIPDKQANSGALAGADSSMNSIINPETSALQVDGADSVGNIGVSDSDEMLQSILAMSPESAHKAAQAFAERMVALLPSDTPTAQQNALKASIVAGIDEYKQQVAQGHEPGIDLSSLVGDAAIEAQLSSSQMQRIVANTDAVAGQFMLLVNNTMHTLSDALQNQFSPVETQIVENNQLRAESSKSQVAFDGADKGVNIHKPEGIQQLHEKIRWMVNARNSMAEIRLDPPELGSMQVRVNMSGDAASVSFVVQSQQAKDALADAMPRLKDMLAEQGITLGESEVRKDNSSQNGNESGQQLAGTNGHHGESGQNIDDDMTIIEQGITKQAMGGIDYYA